MSQKDASDLSSSDNLAVMLYSDAPSDVCSDAYSDDLYSVVTSSDALYSSSDRGPSPYSVVIRESCLL